MNELNKLLSEGLYNQLYEKLNSLNFQYNIEEFTRTFNKVSSEKKYAYLMYVIARAETPELHILMCNFLLFTDTFFFDMYPVQRWHLKRALEISPNNKSVLGWIIDIFNLHPDCPFTKEEMKQYRPALDYL